MKELKWIVFFLPLCLMSWPIGNPSLPTLLEEGLFISDKSWANPQASFQADVLIQKRLDSSESVGGFSIQSASLKGVSEIGILTWNIRERFNLALQLGSGQFDWSWKQNGSKMSGTSNGGLIWGGDARLLIFEIKNTAFSIDGQAGGWDWMDGSASLDKVTLSKAPQTSFRYWQIAAGFSQKISFFSPYIGYAVNDTEFSVTQLSTGDEKFHESYRSGPFIGFSLCNGSYFLFNAEYRGLFEDGTAFSFQLRF